MVTSENATRDRLSKTVLRDFGQPTQRDDCDEGIRAYKVTLPVREAAVPVLLRYALTLIGLRHYGPAEKVAWWVPFTYKGYACELAHEKFGVRLRIVGDLAEDDAVELVRQARKKLASAVNIVEALLTEGAGDILNAGNVTVLNQHERLRGAYEYFRGRAIGPDVVEDLRESGTSEDGSAWRSFRSGKAVMELHALRDLVAAISAFLSSMEHDLVLTLPFLDFNPAADNLTRIIGDRWGDKWRRVVGHSDPAAVKLRKRLTEVVERWRNPYSHGGFEKGHGATVYLHTPGLGALPVGLSSVRDSPLFSFHDVSEMEIADVFALFDEIDAFLKRTFPHATEWIASGLAVRFDEAFRNEAAACIELEDSLGKLIESHGYEQDVISNMDY